LDRSARLPLVDGRVLAMRDRTDAYCESGDLSPEVNYVEMLCPKRRSFDRLIADVVTAL
jgi:hypothetical protein